MKKITYHILFSFLVTIPISLSGQNSFEKQIQGTWEHEKPKTSSGLLLDSDEQPRSDSMPKSIYFFQKDGVLDIKQAHGQTKTHYSISDSTLIIGTRKYKILGFTKTQFIIQESGDLVIFKKKLEFTRTDNRIEPIPFKEKISEFYENGNLKFSGQRESGFENGIWTEWHENGHVKSVIYYNMGAPLMTAEFDEKGSLISKNWFDLNSNSVRTD